MQTRSRTRLWYISAADCEGSTHLAYPSMPKIELEIRMMNGETHFSQEDYGTLTFYFVIMIVLFLLFGNSAIRLYREFKRSETLENPMIILMIGVSSDLF